jgi:serine/threonine-protein kinase
LTRQLPSRFGRYVLFDQIGEGGMARIYLGREQTDLGAERRVVVKHILPLFADSQELSGLLIDEAKLAARLSHGNVVQVYDLGREEGTLYIAMEYVEGFDLAALLKTCSKRKVPLPVEFSLLIVTETLRALDYAHRKKDDEGNLIGLVHRDVSPSNVLVAFDGQIKICDFGIARAIGLDGALPDAAIQGKAGYMSPEAAAGKSVDARSDLFAVGVILWELLAGRRFYKREGGKPPTLEQVRKVVVPALPARNLPQEAELHTLVRRALSVDPDERFASAKEMLRELEAYVAKSGLFASPLKLGEWLTESFGAEIVELRRAREAASHEVDAGPPPDTEPALDSLAGTAAPLAGQSSAPPAPPVAVVAPPDWMRPPANVPAVSPNRNKNLLLIVLGLVVLIIAMLQFMRP